MLGDRFVVMMLVLLTSESFAQQPAPGGSVTTDKGTYQAFEPIIVTAWIVNTSGARQPYGDPSPFSLYKDASVDFDLVTPRGDTLAPFGHRLGGRGDGGMAPLRITLNPGDTLSHTFDAQLVWSTWDTVGQYVLLLKHFTGGGMSTVVALTGFEVTAATGVDSASFAISQLAVNRAFSGYGINDDTESELDSLAGVSSYPTHMREFLGFAYAVSAFSRVGGYESPEATTRYASFVSQYPNSSYHDGRSLQDFLDHRDEEFLFDWETEIPIRIWLEGNYSSSRDSMVSTVTAQGYTPLAEPFDVEPWSHESYPHLDLTPYAPFSSRIVDWVLVGLFDDSTQTLVDMTASLLTTSGWTYPRFVNLSPGQYHVVVDHRNHIAVMSDTLVDMTGGFAEHDFTTGHAFGSFKPQKLTVVGEDTVYVMWAGDGNADGFVTPPDFNLWNAATTAGATGYVASDYNMGGFVTAPDFNLWNANTTAGAATGLTDAQADLLIPRTGGAASQTLQALTGGPGSYIRLRVTRDTGNDYQLNIEARADTSSLPTNTIASVVVDVFYDETEVTLQTTERGVLQAGTYLNSVQQLDKDGHQFIRVSYRASSGGSPWRDLDTDWEIIHKLDFGRDPPKDDAGTSIRLRSLSIEFYDSHANSNGSNRTNESIVEVQ